jgi:hypothetical protein
LVLVGEVGQQKPVVQPIHSGAVVARFLVSAEAAVPDRIQDMARFQVEGEDEEVVKVQVAEILSHQVPTAQVPAEAEVVNQVPASAHQVPVPAHQVPAHQVRVTQMLVEAEVSQAEVSHVELVEGGEEFRCTTTRFQYPPGT